VVAAFFCEEVVAVMNYPMLMTTRQQRLRCMNSGNGNGMRHPAPSTGGYGLGLNLSFTTLF